MKSARIRTLLGLCLATACLLSACKRSEGDSCQTDTDCDDALICCIAPSGVRGSCATSMAECDATSNSSSDDDAGPTE